MQPRYYLLVYFPPGHDIGASNYLGILFDDFKCYDAKMLSDDNIGEIWCFFVPEAKLSAFKDELASRYPTADLMDEKWVDWC